MGEWGNGDFNHEWARIFTNGEGGGANEAMGMGCFSRNAAPWAITDLSLSLMLGKTITGKGGVLRRTTSRGWMGRPFRAGDVFIVETRALPWASLFCPFGASEADQRINQQIKGWGRSPWRRGRWQPGRWFNGAVVYRGGGLPGWWFAGLNEPSYNGGRAGGGGFRVW